MSRINPGRDVDYDFAAAWLESMKRVFQRTLDKHARSGRMEGADIIKARNHLRAMAVLQKMLAEHHEMANGQRYNAGHIGFALETLATLIKPNGEVITIRKGNGHG